MKKRAKGKKAGRGANSRGSKGPRVWTIVLVDQEPIRRKAANDCQREMTRMEKARADWKRYEQEDLPAFAKWMAATFGALQTEMRELTALVRSKESMIEEVEIEMAISGIGSYEMAYAALRLRKEMEQARWKRERSETRREASEPDSEQEWQQEEPEPAAREDAEMEQEMESVLMFEEYLESFLGIPPESLNEAKYNRMFEDFKRKILGEEQRMEEEASRGQQGGRDGEKPSRLKELYRILVRRLHPDTKADTDANVSALWHEVQEAYSRGNIERLEMLLALTDIQSETTGEHTTVGQMLAVLKELRRSLHALLQTLSQAKKEMAWDFARLGGRPTLERRIGTQMERDRDYFRQQLQELETFIASWTAPRGKRQSKRRSAGQPEFFS